MVNRLRSVLRLSNGRQRCATYGCSDPAYTEIWQRQVDGTMGWTVLCERHGSKRGRFRRDERTRKLIRL